MNGYTLSCKRHVTLKKTYHVLPCPSLFPHTLKEPSCLRQRSSLSIPWKSKYLVLPEELLKSWCLYYQKKKPNQNKTKTTNSTSQFMKSTLFYWTFFYFCKKKIKITNSNKQDWWGEQQFSRTNVTFAINVNVFHMVVYCT